MQRYEKYKDSGVKYIGEIPNNWQILKGKRLFKEEKRAVRKEDEIITCFRDGQVTLRRLRKTEGFTNSLKEIGYQGIRAGDLVVHNMDAFAGAIGIAEYDGKATPVYSVCTERNNNTLNLKFYSYYLRNLAVRGLILSLAKGIRERSTDFRFSDLGDLDLPYPSIPEQTAIAQFLDDKTAKIDQTIAIRQKEIELLKERRQILIQQAVTKGLDATVPMKDSGVDWIGEIPEHWEVRKLRRVGNIVNGATPSSSETAYWNGEIVWVTPTDINNIKIIYDSERKISEAGYRNCGTTRVPIGSVVLTTRAPIGKVVIAGTELCTNQGCKSVVIDEKLIGNKFLYYQILINSETLNGLGSGTTFKELSNKELKDFKINLPKLPEQTEIVSYLEKIEEKIAKAITLKEQEIEKLKEYKTVLIDQVVTGKVRVS